MSTASIWDVPVAAPSQGGDFVPCPAGNYRARIAAILDIGHQPTVKTDDKTKEKYEADTRQLYIVYELSKKQPNGEPYTMGQKMTFSMNERANLFTLVQNLTGQKPLPGSNFSLPTLLGKPCMVNVSLGKPNAQGKSYSSIGSVSAFPEGMEEPAWKYEPVMWSVLERFTNPFPERAWFPWDYGKSLKDRVGMSCEVCGTTPRTRGRSVETAPSNHTFNAPAPSPGGDYKSYMPEADALREKYGLKPGYGEKDLQEKLDDIPARDYRVLDQFVDAVPF